ncbi:hypothetical protein V5O48_006255 [Marasmius crinis-equi]|uniref:Fe2OG dioxygenase domain-containing protein n=1 Tax=Marasmius crinis-equi TaxID=585013 RepID=A0ABR3FKJ1_9AGAR
MSSPAEQIEIARAAVVKSDPWISGTAKVPMESLQLYYREKANTSLARFLELKSDASAEDLSALSASCERATFGRANQDVLDESYRKAGKMDLTNFASKLDIHQTRILSTVVPHLLRGEASKREVEAELYKLNVYDKGSFFRAHKDTPRSERMFGSLVIVFPTSHTGGQLVLRHDGKEFTFDSAKVLAGSTDTIAFVAFFSDVEHEVLPVTDGHRVTLTYNLYYSTPSTALFIPPAPLVDHTSQLNATLSALLENPEFSPKGGFLGFGLTHSYPVVPGKTKLDDLIPVLKGSDQVISVACSQLGLNVSIKTAFEDEDWNGVKQQILLDTAVDLSDYGQIEESWSVLFLEEGRGTLVHPYNKEPSPVKGFYRSPRSKAVTWISPLSDCTSGYNSAYLAYGNEASLNLEYVKLSLVAAFGPSGDRGNWGAYDGEEAKTD